MAASQAPEASAPASEESAAVAALVKLLETQQERSAELQKILLVQQDQHRLQMETVQNKLDSLSSQQEESVPPDVSNNLPNWLYNRGNEKVDWGANQPFRESVFDQNFVVHMVILISCSLLIFNMMFLMSACSGLPKLILSLLLSAFVGLAGTRWVARNNNGSRGTTMVAATSSSITVLVAFLAVSAFIAFVGYVYDSSNLCDGQTSVFFETILPSWWSHVSLMEVLFGILLSTYGVRMQRVIIFGAAIHGCFFFTQTTILQAVADETHTLRFMLANQAVQYFAFALGIFIGDRLLNGQKRYYDEAAALRIDTLEQRLEQLAAEKERADYDRQMVQHAFKTLTVERSAEALKDDARSESLVSASRERLRQNNEYPVVSSSDDDRVSNSSRSSGRRGCPVAPPEPPPANGTNGATATALSAALGVAGLSGGGGGGSEQGDKAADLAHVPLPGDELFDRIQIKGKAASSSGWSDLSRMLAQTTSHRIEGMDRPMSPASMTSLNPHARVFNREGVAAREQMSAQEQLAQMGMQPQAGGAQAGGAPATRKEAVEAGETPRKTGAAIRRDKRNRKAARELEAAVSAQKAEVEALRKQQAMVGMAPMAPMQQMHPMSNGQPWVMGAMQAPPPPPPPPPYGYGYHHPGYG